MKQKLEVKGVKGSNFKSGTLLLAQAISGWKHKHSSPLHKSHRPPCDPQHFAAILLKKLASVVPCLNRWQFVACGRHFPLIPLFRALIPLSFFAYSRLLWINWMIANQWESPIRFFSAGMVQVLLPWSCFKSDISLLVRNAPFMKLSSSQSSSSSCLSSSLSFSLSVLKKSQKIRTSYVNAPKKQNALLLMESFKAKKTSPTSYFYPSFSSCS